MHSKSMDYSQIEVWYEAFEGLDTMTENYIRNMRANGETLNKNPRISNVNNTRSERR